MSKKQTEPQNTEGHPIRSVKLSVPAKLTLDEARNGEYVTTTEAAKMLRVSISALQNWRTRGRGPQCFRVPGTRANLYCREDVRDLARSDGRSIRWRKREIDLSRDPQQTEIEDWLEENKRLVADDTAEAED